MGLCGGGVIHRVCFAGRGMNAAFVMGVVV